MNVNENTASQYLQDTAKTMQRDKCIPVNNCIKKEEKSQIKDLTLHFKELEEERTKPIASRRKEIKMRTQMKEIETRKIEIVNESKS